MGTLLENNNCHTVSGRSLTQGPVSGSQSRQDISIPTENQNVQDSTTFFPLYSITSLLIACHPSLSLTIPLHGGCMAILPVLLQGSRYWLTFSHFWLVDLTCKTCAFQRVNKPFNYCDMSSLDTWPSRCKSKNYGYLIDIQLYRSSAPHFFCPLPTCLCNHLIT